MTKTTTAFYLTTRADGVLVKNRNGKDSFLAMTCLKSIFFKYLKNMFIK